MCERIALFVSQLAAVRILLRRVGLLRSLQAGWAIVTVPRVAQPLVDVEAHGERGTKLACRQLRPLILLYRVLAQRPHWGDAFTHIRALVLDAGMPFMRVNLGNLAPRRLGRMSPRRRRRFVESRGRRFFNAQIRWDSIAADRVQFTVLRCVYPQLCRQAGAPELAPLFCEVDAHYFGRIEAGVQLHRAETIAAGAQSCPFVLVATASAAGSAEAGERQASDSS